MEKNNKYNGWTNYATWRIYTEFFSDVEEIFCDDLEVQDEPINVICRRLEMEVDNYIIENSNQNLVQDYAFAFLQDVNYYEIAEHIYDNYLIEQEQ